MKKESCLFGIEGKVGIFKGNGWKLKKSSKLHSRNGAKSKMVGNKRKLRGFI